MAGFEESAEDLDERIEKLVLDLRGNTFGTPGEAARAASLLVGQGVMAKLQERERKVGRDRKVDLDSLDGKAKSSSKRISILVM